MPQYMPLRHLISSALGFAPGVSIGRERRVADSDKTNGKLQIGHLPVYCRERFRHCRW